MVWVKIIWEIQETSDKLIQSLLLKFKTIKYLIKISKFNNRGGFGVKTNSRILNKINLVFLVQIIIINKWIELTKIAQYKINLTYIVSNNKTIKIML